MKSVFWLLCACALGGCGLVTAVAERQALTRAEFSFKTAEFTHLGVPVIDADPRAELNVTLGVKNPNPIAAALDRVDYEVVVQETVVGRGALSRDFRVEAGKSRDLVLPVTVRYAGLAAPVLDALLERRIAVAIRGTSHLTTPIGTLAFPLEVRGGTAF
jgi:LEA14-like dessication related protein